MSLSALKSHIKLSGIGSIPLWILGGLFLYVFASVDIGALVNKASLTAKSTADISNLDARIPHQNDINLLKRPLVLVKSSNLSSKFDHFNDGKKFSTTRLNVFGMVFVTSRAFEKIINIGFTKYIYVAKQRAPPSLV